MSFKKHAAVTTLAIATFENSSFKKSASYKDNSSIYLDGKKPIDIKAAISLVAKEYDLSDNPSDYIFEAIRGNTTNVPNENKDAFHKHELLRFDHRLGKQVYRTYELKPHHINHRAENPKNARGFIIDVHYNDASPALDECPNCGGKTASEADRDPDTGIHCRKCGSVVKDEFVELLIAIDTKKDPTFAKGIQSGVLKHGSMGCSCLRTRCNVCGNVAYNRNEFCKHIKSGNKGKEYDESEPGFSPIAFIIKFPKDKIAGKMAKTAKAFEWCEGVIYDEYSRVHDPADPKAEQYELLKMSERIAQLSKEDMLQNESEILTLQARVAELEKLVENKLTKTALAAPPSPGLPPSPDLPPSPGLPSSAGLPPPAGLPSPESMEPPMDLEKDKDKNEVNIYVNSDEEGVKVTTPKLEEEGLEKTPIGELTPEEMGATPAGPGATLSPPAMGIVPETTPPKRGSKKKGASMLRFADSYKNLKAEITTAGNIRIHDDEGTLFVVKPNRLDNSKIASSDQAGLAKNVLLMIAQYGVGGTINKTSAIIGPRLGQILSGYHDDMVGVDRDDTSSVLDDADTDASDKRSSSPDTVTGKGSTTDRKEDYDETVSLKDDVLSGHETDAEDEKNERDPKKLDVVEMSDSDTKEKRKDWDLGQSAIDDITLDHQDKTATTKSNPDYDIKRHAARLEKLYNSRLEKKIAEIENEKTAFINNITERLGKAMKIVAKRQALNLEYSPLKTAMGIILCNARSLGGGYEYQPMDQKTAVTLVEAAFNDPIINDTDKPAWESFIDGLFERAASVMKWNDETLMQVEADLANIKTASVPIDDAPNYMEDISLRQAAKTGNLQLTTSSQEEQPSVVAGKRNAIKQAVGTTKVASLASFSR